MEPDNSLATQVGGTHYKKYEIQPIEYCQKNGLNYCESNVIKYITRWRDKGGIEDLKKAKHMIDLLIEIERLEPLFPKPKGWKEMHKELRKAHDNQTFDYKNTYTII